MRPVSYHHTTRFPQYTNTQTLPLKVKRSIPVLGPACPRCDAAAVEGVGGGDLGSKQQLQQGPGADARVVVVRVCYRFVGGETEGQQG